MFTWLDALSSLPNFLPLLLFAGVVLLLPTLLAILLRLQLHGYLSYLVRAVDRLPDPSSSSSSSRPPVPGIVKRLESRFQEASIKLDQVNTPALIDGLYSEERFPWLGLKLQCEKVEYFSRTLPNLLLNFGLLGTFLGISINLIGLNQQLTETQQVDTSQATEVIQLLQGPLEGMSIAFLTSLVAVFCSSVLVLVNIFWNTGILRNQLISSLEDYLDNTVHPHIDNRERLDKAISQMVTLQKTTLTTLESTVTEQVERYLTEVSTTIAQANLRSAEIAEQVYQRFLESAQILSTTAHQFEGSLVQMATQMDRYAQITQALDQLDLPQRLTAAGVDLIRSQDQFSATVSQLLQGVAVIEAHGGDLRQSSQGLRALVEQMQVAHQDLYQLIEQGSQVQDRVGQAMPQLSQQVGRFADGMAGVQAATQQLHTLEEKIERRSAYLEDIQGELTRLIEVITLTMTERDAALTQVQGRLDKRLESVISRLERGGQDLRILRDEFTQLVLLLSELKEPQPNAPRSKASLGYMLDWLRPKRGHRDL